MDFRLNEDQQALQQAAKEFLAKEVTSAVIRDAFEGADGDSRELYAHMADLGWLALTVPEAQGGLGMGPIEQAVVCEQLGYVNAPGPYFSTACLAIPALLALGANAEAEPLIAGTKRGTVSSDDGFVLDGQLADGVLVVADERASWFDRGALAVRPLDTMDGTRRFASIGTTGAGRDLGPADAIGAAIDTATIALCAEMVGGMQWALDTTVEYVKVRQQFGRPIGTFQAVKHRLADMLMQTESARSAVYYAAWAMSTGAPDAAYAASIAKAYCSDAAIFVTGEGIQLHGGIGFTWEHDMHLYFKRAETNAVVLGDAAEHRERALRLDPEVVKA